MCTYGQFHLKLTQTNLFSSCGNYNMFNSFVEKNTFLLLEEGFDNFCIQKFLSSIYFNLWMVYVKFTMGEIKAG